MRFKENLIKARSNLIFLAALICGLFVVMTLENRMPTSSNQTMEVPAVAPTERSTPAIPAIQTFTQIAPLPLAVTGANSSRDLEHARIAWRYFENNTNTETGLVNSADQYPSTTMWETGSYFIAVISADLLGVIDTENAVARLSTALQTLATMRLFDDILPNKAYNTQTAQLVNYSNQPVERGLGWSALDVARMVAALHHVEQSYPVLSGQVDAVLDHWDLDQMVANGDLIGGNISNGTLRRDQEGRVGYGQYAAKAMMLYGYDVINAYDAEAHLMAQHVEGHAIPVDDRLHRNTTPAFTVSEPYVFDGLEFGFDDRSHRFATTIYRAQETRWRETGQLTAVSESHLDEAPYFAYSTIWGGGAPWAVMTFSGDRIDSKRTVTVKTAFAWDALFGTQYTAELVTALAELGDPNRGWPEGIYEIDGSVNGSFTTNTNAVVLASLAFRGFGPLSRVDQ